jgi:DnaJ-class molecular chaperone
MRDLYAILGVKRDASADEIKRAYRRLAKELHPDLNPGKKGIEARFKEVTAAHEILGDPEKRARYDRGEIDETGAETQAFRFRRAHAGAGAGPTEGFASAGFDDIGDILSDLFGSFDERVAPRRRGRAAAHAGEVTIGFLEAARGVRKRIGLPDGSTVEVAIPGGTADGRTLRLPGKGPRGGDLHVTVRVRPDPAFRVEGADVRTTVEVPVADAILGGRIVVQTIDGPVTMTVPKGSNGGTTLRLKGKGLPRAGGHGRGDQLVELRLRLPDPADPELVAFAESWRRRHGGKGR